MTATILTFPQKPLTRRYDDAVREACIIAEQAMLLAMNAVEMQIEIMRMLTNNYP